MKKLPLSTLPLALLCALFPALVGSCSNESDGDPAAISAGAATGTSSGGPSAESSNPTSVPSASSSAPSSNGPGASEPSDGTGGSGPSAGSTMAPGSGPMPGTSDTGMGGAASAGTAGSPGLGGAGGAGTGGSGTENGGGSTSMGGSGGGGGSTSTGGSGTAGTGGGMASGGLENDPVPSAGCDNAEGLQALTAGGMSVSGGLPTSTRLGINDREYIIDIPADYDPTHPYRLIFSWHQAYGSANGNAVGQFPAGNGPNFDAQNYAYFGLHREATAAGEPAIFVAPEGIGNLPWNYERDVELFDDLLATVTSNLCIDESRVFTTGFSFGAMMSHALSIGRQSVLRAAVTMAPANYNFTQPPDTNAPFAYMGITGMSDGTCEWERGGNSTTEGGKYCVLHHAENSGCTTADFPTAMVGSRDHVCYEFEGCDEGYPVKVCTFDGGHTPSAVADGMSNGDDGLNAFVPPLAWEFISQF